MTFNFFEKIKKLIRVGIYIVVGLFVLSGSGVVIYGGWHYLFEWGLQVSNHSNAASVRKILNRSSPSDFNSSTNKSPKTIVLVTLDTLRTDHLSTYGYYKKTSPNLDRFASGGVQFNRAFTSMPTTAPAHATIFSSLYPIQHRVIKNGLMMRTDIKTLPEYLRNRQDYTTAAFVSTNRHFGTSRVAQGFDIYNDPERSEQFTVKTNDTSPQNLQYRPAERTVRKTVKWLENTSTENVFLWVHLFDPHYPYVPRDSVLSEITFDSQEYRNKWIDYLRKNHYFNLKTGNGTLGKTSRRWLKAHQLYDSEIRYLDQAFGRLMKRIRDSRGDEILTIVAGDHGEGMGNHSYWGHGKYLYNEQIRVPLMIQFPEGRYSGREAEQVVELNDVMPTVLRETDIDSSILDERQVPIEGTPLQKLLNGNTDPFQYALSQRRKYSENWLPYFAYSSRSLLINPENYPFRHRTITNYETGKTYSLVGNQSKYIHKTHHRDEYYDLSSDFYEQNNQLQTDQKDVRMLGTSLRNVVELLKHSGSNDNTGPVDEETRKKLEGLGYF